MTLQTQSVSLPFINHFKYFKRSWHNNKHIQHTQDAKSYGGSNDEPIASTYKEEV